MFGNNRGLIVTAVPLLKTAGGCHHRQDKQELSPEKVRLKNFNMIFAFYL